MDQHIPGVRLGLDTAKRSSRTALRSLHCQRGIQAAPSEQTRSKQGPKQGEGTVRSAWGHSLRALINKNKCSSSPKEMFWTFQSHFVWSWSKQRGKALAPVTFIVWNALCTVSAPTSSYLTWNSSSLINDLWSGPASLLPSAALSIEYSLRAQIPQTAGEENLSGQQLHTAYVAVFMERVNMKNRCIWF